LVLTEPARYGKRPVDALGDPDRLLPIGSDPSQLAKAAISQTLAIAQKEASQQTPPDDRYRRRAACDPAAAG
jgi:hypothetical protein